jgi:hypothetical protein
LELKEDLIITGSLGINNPAGAKTLPLWVSLEKGEWRLIYARSAHRNISNYQWVQEG